MAFVFIRLKWNIKPVHASIWYADINQTEVIKQDLKIGQEINLQILDARYCVGTDTGNSGWITCLQRQHNEREAEIEHHVRFIHPEDTIVIPENTSHLVDTRRFIQCYRCATTEFFACRMICQGDLCDPSTELARRHCIPSNTTVYLTYVGGEYKVGVSLNYLRRWIEQGSDLAAQIAVLPGLEARRLEQRVALDLNLKLQVRGKTKLTNLNKIDIITGNEKLRSILDASQPLIDEMIDAPRSEKLQPKIYDLSKYYGEYDTSIPINIIEAGPNAEFGGTIQAIKGSIVITKRGDYLYAMDFKQLISYSFEFLSREASMPTQSFLDQWF